MLQPAGHPHLPFGFVRPLCFKGRMFRSLSHWLENEKLLETTLFSGLCNLEHVNAEAFWFLCRSYQENSIYLASGCDRGLQNPQKAFYTQIDPHKVPWKWEGIGAPFLYMDRGPERSQQPFIKHKMLTWRQSRWGWCGNSLSNFTTFLYNLLCQNKKWYKNTD